MADVLSTVHRIIGAICFLFACSATVWGQAVDPFHPGVDGAVYAIAIQPDGKILIGGDFTGVNCPTGACTGAPGETTAGHLARLNADGTPDTGFQSLVLDAAVNSILVQTDGRIVIGGSFTSISSGTGAFVPVTRNHIARLNANGTVDTTFNPGANSSVYTLALQADGEIVLGGLFTGLGGGTGTNHVRMSLGRLNTDGTVDAAFNPGSDGWVNNLAIQADGKIVVGGFFLNLAGSGGAGAVPRLNIGRLNTDGTVDGGFDPGASSEIYALALQADGKILVAGDFIFIGGGGAGNASRQYIARLNAAGTVDGGFDPGAQSNPYTLAVQTDGKILVGGSFQALGGSTGTTTRKFIGRLNADGTVDGTFDPGANASVYGLAIQPDGQIVVGGQFSGLGGGTGTSVRHNLGRLLNSGAATQSIVVSGGGTTVTWLRGGTGPEVTRAAFATSTDGLTYTFLGNAVRVTGGWEMTGVTLPTGPGATIRARGFYSSGYGGASPSSIAQLITGPTGSVPPPAVDLNGDGSGDVFIYDAATGAFAFETTLAGGGFSQQNGAWAPGWTVTPARFNNDALTDVFLFNPSNGQYFRLLNNGAGGWTTDLFGGWSTHWQRFVVDLNGDGTSDVFLWDPVLGQWFRCLSTAGAFTYEFGFWAPGWEVYPVRFNADARQDFFLFNRTNGQWFQVLGETAGFSYPGFGGWSPVWQFYPGDYNADGISDLLLHNPANGQYFVATTTVGNSFTYVFGAFSLGWNIHPSDLDANGRTDLLMHSPTAGQWFQMLSDGVGGFTVGGTGFWSLGWNVYVTDLNADGRGDVFLYNPTNGQWFQARNLTLGTFDYTAGGWSTGLTVVARPGAP